MKVQDYPGKVCNNSSVVKNADCSDKEFIPAFDKLSDREKEIFRQKLQELKAAKKGKRRAERLMRPIVEPVDRETYIQGMLWLDKLAGYQ